MYIIQSLSQFLQTISFNILRQLIYFQGYTLFYTWDLANSLEEWTHEMVVSKQTTTLKKLSPKTTYYAKLRAFNDKGPGPLSETFSFTTELESNTLVTKILFPNDQELIRANMSDYQLVRAISSQQERLVAGRSDLEQLNPIISDQDGLVEILVAISCKQENQDLIGENRGDYERLLETMSF